METNIDEIEKEAMIAVYDDHKKGALFIIIKELRLLREEMKVLADDVSEINRRGK